MSVRQIVNWMSNTRKRRVVPLLSKQIQPLSKVDRTFLGEKCISELLRSSFTFVVCHA
jgi:hypothetical protein